MVNYANFVINVYHRMHNQNVERCVIGPRMKREKLIGYKINTYILLESKKLKLVKCLFEVRQNTNKINVRRVAETQADGLSSQAKYTR